MESTVLEYAQATARRSLGEYLYQVQKCALDPLHLYREILKVLPNLGDYVSNTLPFTLSLHVLTLLLVYTWCASMVTNNYSQVDHLWSLAPVAYAWTYLLKCGVTKDYRMLAATMLITAWGGRLTYNFWRKGAYQNKHEDYRWVWLQDVVRAPYGLVGEIAWQLFNLFFIASYQNVLLWALVSPVMHVLSHAQPLTSFSGNQWDVLVLCLAASCLILEAVADEQQWEFQSTKYAFIKFKKRQLSASNGASASKTAIQRGTKSILSKIPYPYSLGFPTTGLFRYSRHPNFFAEMSFWLCIYLMALVATTSSSLVLAGQFAKLPIPTSFFIALGSDWTQFYVFVPLISQKVIVIPFLQWSGIGVFNLILLFQSSTWITELISSSKYPLYARYAAQTSRFVPGFARGMGNV